MPTKKTKADAGPLKSAVEPPLTAPPLPADQKLKPQLDPMPAEPGQPPEQGIGARLRYARNEVGLSIEALARYTANFDLPSGRGISATTLLRYENGDPLPGARELRILAEAFDVPPQWLLLGTIDNAGQDAIEQRLLDALEKYVHRRQADFTVGDVRIGKLFPKFDSATRWRWMAEAKKPSADK